MSKKDKKEIPMWAQLGHGKPVSRRDLLASGLISFSAYLVLPSWLSLVSSTAQAQTISCPQAAGGLIPFLNINLSGGAGLQANFVPHDQANQRLASYSRMGLGSSGANLPIELEFGNVPFAGKKPGTQVLISQFLAGVRSKAPNAISKTAFVGVCSRGRDDTNENRLSTAGLLAQAGLQGTILPNLGARRTITGVNHQSAILNPPPPLFTNDLNAIVGAVVPSGELANQLSVNQRSSLLSLVSKLSSTQVRKLSSDTQGTQTKNLLECANIRNEQVKSMIDSGSAVIDPRRDSRAASLNPLWSIDSGTASNNNNLVFATMTYNVLAGNAGAAGLELGGYDYHNNTRTTGDTRDFNAGELVGRALESAHIMGKKLFIHVSTDGAVDSGGADNASFQSVWTSDRGSANLSYILYYDPAGRAATSGFQVNHFTAGQASDDSTPLGTPEGAAVAVFANYLKLNRRMDLMPTAAADILNPTLLNRAIKFG